MDLLVETKSLFYPIFSLSFSLLSLSPSFSLLSLSPSFSSSSFAVIQSSSNQERESPSRLFPNDAYQVKCAALATIQAFLSTDFDQPVHGHDRHSSYVVLVCLIHSYSWCDSQQFKQFVSSLSTRRTNHSTCISN